MSGEKFPGVITGTIVELRFPFSGTVRTVAKRVGDIVRHGELVASLEVSLLQKELDIQLSNSEKERADFEIFNLKNKSPDTLQLHQKKIAQASLDAAVRSVEVAKVRLDQAQLISPVSGLIIDVGGLAAGLNITPSANSLQVLDFSGFSFRLEIPQETLSLFRQPHRTIIRLPNFPDELTGVTSPPLPGQKSKFVIAIRLPPNPLLLPGMFGEVELTE